jgi:hypothetical protein
MGTIFLTRGKIKGKDEYSGAAEPDNLSSRQMRQRMKTLSKKLKSGALKDKTELAQLAIKQSRM